MNPSSLSNWHVAYTMPNAEKKVASQMMRLGIQSYLPTMKVIRQWSDRKKKLEMPLFPSYVFVKVSSLERTSVLSIKQVVKFVSIEKKPVVVKESEISLIKTFLSKDVCVEHEEYFQEGDRVRVIQGEFVGVEGIIINKQGCTRLLIKVEGISQAFSINISIYQVQPAGK